MVQKDDIELRHAALIKAARSAIRLRHSIAADAEMNEVLPRLEQAFTLYVQRGELPDVAALLRENNVADGE